MTFSCSFFVRARKTNIWLMRKKIGELRKYLDKKLKVINK